ncbi:YfcL family protein [Catenovulum sediminis]|uniref:YfcL family protein n=1 Tax=Catenovulum sediminis TaxID=1740262 RepID=A0ABV1RKF8_9ALTE|nr:YfcL family protein [Catenovulum sediminis]
MTTSVSQNAQNYLDKIEKTLDDMVSTADDDMLFISGYLRGHIMLAAGYLEMDDKLEIDALNQAATQSLLQAVENGELDSADKTRAFDLWNDLQKLQAS